MCRPSKDMLYCLPMSVLDAWFCMTFSHYYSLGSYMPLKWHVKAAVQRIELNFLIRCIFFASTLLLLLSSRFSLVQGAVTLTWFIQWKGFSQMTVPNSVTREIEIRCDAFFGRYRWFFCMSSTFNSIISCITIFFLKEANVISPRPWHYNRLPSHLPRSGTAGAVLLPRVDDEGGGRKRKAERGELKIKNPVLLLFLSK